MDIELVLLARMACPGITCGRAGSQGGSAGDGSAPGGAGLLPSCAGSPCLVQCTKDLHLQLLLLRYGLHDVVGGCQSLQWRSRGQGLFSSERMAGQV